MFSLYTLFKFLHVTGAIIWIGAVASLSLLTARLARTQDRGALTVLLEQTRFVGAVLTGPAALVTLLAGMATAGTAGFDFGALWITWGFAGIILSVLLGATLMRRTNQKLIRLAATDDSSDEELREAQQQMGMLNWLNLIILLSVVGAMIFKPTI